MKSKNLHSNGVPPLPLRKADVHRSCGIRRATLALAELHAQLKLEGYNDETNRRLRDMYNILTKLDRQLYDDLRSSEPDPLAHHVGDNAKQYWRNWDGRHHCDTEDGDPG